MPELFLQGMKNNVRFQLVLVTLHKRFTSETNGIGDTKFNIQYSLSQQTTIG